MNDETTQNEQEQVQAEGIYGAYGKDKDEYTYAKTYIEQVNEDYELREQATMISNGLSYSDGYEYNQQKGINYAPPRNKKDDREVSMGLVHEKIIGLSAIFLKHVFKRDVKCYDHNGKLVRGLGKIYDLAIEYSHQLEQLTKKIALIYWETFTQGNAFILEDWVVSTTTTPVAYNGKERVTPDSMDYTYEFLDGLRYEKGETVQERKAVTRLLDGRCVIFGNPEIEEVQDQPRITLEFSFTKAEAEALFGTLTRWDKVPKTRQELITTGHDKLTIFDAKRFKKDKDTFIAHLALDKENNRYNWFVNGVMLLPRETPMTLFYPRNNYPLTNIPAERLRGSIYARSIPAKTKFNADYVDWVFKMLANKFEQGVDPAILTKGKYVLTRDIFRGGQVTHGVSREMYEKADPDNKGITQSEFSFAQLIKEVIESQSLNQTTTGELSSGNTAYEIAKVDQAQTDKLGYLLDGIMNGFVDMNLRRAETIESKYTIKQRETMVDGKKINVYQNFTINVGGIENVVEFDDTVGTIGYDTEVKRDELFTQAFQDKKKGFMTEYYLANPKLIRYNKYNLVITMTPERIKDKNLQLAQLWEEMTQVVNLFGNRVKSEEMQKIYLETSGRPDSLFQSGDVLELEERELAQNSESAQELGRAKQITNI